MRAKAYSKFMFHCRPLGIEFWAPIAVRAFQNGSECTRRLHTSLISKYPRVALSIRNVKYSLNSSQQDKKHLVNVNHYCHTAIGAQNSIPRGLQWITRKVTSRHAKLSTKGRLIVQICQEEDILWCWIRRKVTSRRAKIVNKRTWCCAKNEHKRTCRCAKIAVKRTCHCAKKWTQKDVSLHKNRQQEVVSTCKNRQQEDDSMCTKLNTKDVSMHKNCHQEDDSMCKVVLKRRLVTLN